MKFTKEELNFLNYYVSGSDTKNVIHDKIHVETFKELGKVLFAQISKNISFATYIDKNIDEDINITISVNDLFNLVNTAIDDVVDISDSGISFPSGGKYELGNFDFSYEDINSLIQNVEDEDTARTKMSLTNLSKLGRINSFIGAEDELSAIAVMNGHYVSSNRYDVTSAIQSKDMNKNHSFFITDKTVNIINSQKIEELDIYNMKEQGFYYFELNNTLVFVNTLEYVIPDLFEKEMYNSFMHPLQVSVKANELKANLNRIKIVASKNLEGRISITLNNGSVTLESNENGYAKEEIEATVPAEIVGQSFILSVNFLSTILSSLSGKTVIIRVMKEEENDYASTITIQDELEDRFFIHCLYEKLD